MNKPKSKPKQPAVSVRSETHAAIAQRAERQGTSISHTLDRLILGALSASSVEAKQ